MTRKKNVTENFQFVLWRVENSVGKGQNAGYKHFFLLPWCFQKSIKFVIRWKKLSLFFRDGNQHFLLFPQCSPSYFRKLCGKHLYFVVCRCSEFVQVLNFVVWKRVKNAWLIHKSIVHLSCRRCNCASSVLFFCQKAEFTFLQGKVNYYYVDLSPWLIKSKFVGSTACPLLDFDSYRP